MLVTRWAGSILLVSWMTSCSPTYQVGNTTLTEAEYEQYQAERHQFFTRCDEFRRDFGRTITLAINGEISSGELEQEYNRRPVHADLTCQINRRALVGPEPREEDYLSLLETRARASFAREKAAEKCGRPQSALTQHLTCVSNYMTYWSNTGKTPDAPKAYIEGYKGRELRQTPFDQFKGVEYYFAMREAERRLAEFEFLYLVKATRTNSLDDQLRSIDSRLYSIERRLE